MMANPVRVRKVNSANSELLSAKVIRMNASRNALTAWPTPVDPSCTPLNCAHRAQWTIVHGHSDTARFDRAGPMPITAITPYRSPS